MNNDLRTFVVTVNTKMVITFEGAMDATERDGIIHIIGRDGGAIAIFAPGEWKSVIWAQAKMDRMSYGQPRPPKQLKRPEQVQ